MQIYLCVSSVHWETVHTPISKGKEDHTDWISVVFLLIILGRLLKFKLERWWLGKGVHSHWQYITWKPYSYRFEYFLVYRFILYFEFWNHFLYSSATILFYLKILTIFSCCKAGTFSTGLLDIFFSPVCFHDIKLHQI